MQQKMDHFEKKHIRILNPPTVSVHSNIPSIKAFQLAK